MIYVVIVVIGLLSLILLYQIGSIFDLVSIFKGEKDEYKDSNKLNAYLLLAFMIVFLVAIVWSGLSYKKYFLSTLGSASEHGEMIDSMFNQTLFWTGLIFFITQIALFWFAFKYRKREGQKASFFHEDNKLEVLWTVIPSIVLVYLVVVGARSWYNITAAPPKDAVVVEATAYQFGWTFRYPGKDNKLGRRHYTLITPENTLGVDYTDEAAKDDIIVSNELYLPNNKAVLVKIRSLDVLHAFYLPHFRVKMDAVPGTPTRFSFKPKLSTAQMRKRLNKPEFNYELACAEMCGKGHFGMMRPVVVVEEDEFNNWLNEQIPYYDAVINKSKDKSEEEEETVIETETESAEL